MKLFGKKYVLSLCLVLVLAGAAIFAGCVSLSGSTPKQTKTPEQPFLIVTPEAAWEQFTVTPAPQAAFGSQTGMTTANLDYGVTISYPVDWRKEDKGVTIVRDYGRTVINIANLYSPNIYSDRINAAGSNPDKQKYTSLTIDVDPVATADFERYFNLATLAVGNRYADLEITKRNVVLRISITNAFPAGYKSYELDFDTEDMRGKYIFTNVDGTIYIFAYRNPSPYSKEIEDIYKSIVITPIM
jgi:hypothetical protein